MMAVFGTAEAVTNVVIPYENLLASSDAGVAAKPLYMFADASKAQDLLTGITARPDLRTRVRGIGVTVTTASAPVFNSFNGQYTARYGSNPQVSSMGPSYDAMYAIIYALAGISDAVPTGALVAQRLAKLGTGGTTIDVGPTKLLSAFQHITAQEPISPLGTFGPLLFDANGDIVAGSVEAWCVKLAGPTPVYASSGLTMDVSSQQMSGTYDCP